MDFLNDMFQGTSSNTNSDPYNWGDIYQTSNPMGYQNLMKQAGIWDGFTDFDNTTTDPSMRAQAMARQNTDWDRLTGYSIGDYRDNSILYRALKDPTGKVVGQTQVYSPESLRSEDYANMAAIAMPALSGTLSPFIGAVGEGAVFGAVNSAIASGGDLGDTLKGGMLGGGLAYLPNASSYTDITDPIYSNMLDGGVKGAIGGAITGGKEGIAGGAITGGIMGGLRGYDASQAHYSPTDSRQALLNDITQTSYAPNDSGGYQSPTSGRSYALSADSGQSFAPAYTSNGSYNAPEMQAPSESTWASPDLGALMGNILPSSARGWGDLAQGALGMYGAYKQRKMARDLQRQIGGNRKAYQTQLTRDLQRRDAASGRRSNYSGRATELQSSLAQLDSRNAPALAQLQQAELGGLVNMFRTGLRYGNKAGWFGSPDTQQQPAMQPQQPLYLPSLIGQQQGPQDYSVDQQRKIKLGGYGG